MPPNSPSVRARYERVLVAVDSSPDSEAASAQAADLARRTGARLTGLHVYAAKLHDRRFRQMEGVLPAEFQKDDELERQRDVHDSLITRGLGMISDSYLDETEKLCVAAEVPFERLGTEGKNYRAILDHLAEGTHDLLVMGFQGLGAVRGDAPGSVCLRVARQTMTDTLIVREEAPPIGTGPIVVAVDGSELAYGAVLTAVELGKRYGAPVHVVAVYDPNFHTVAFRRIGEVINERGAQVFHLEDQEKLHGDIIDTGLAGIYRGHLEIAKSLAEELGCEVVTELLQGKPYEAILPYLERTEASLLLVGKVGIHADEGLDIGGNTEHLLHFSRVPLLIACRPHRPADALVADHTLAFSEEAEASLARMPAAIAPMARKAIVGWAIERGHTVVTASIVREATAALLSGRQG